MTVFKTFLKILNRCKVMIIVYSVILIAFAAFNMQTRETGTDFVASKPDVAIINNDVAAGTVAGDGIAAMGISKGLVSYMEECCNVMNIKDEGDNLNDALFYRDLNFIIYIPEGFSKDFMDGKKPEIEVKSTGDYNASYARMLLERYIETAESYRTSKPGLSEDEIVQNTGKVLSQQAEISITSKLDTDSLSKSTFYYNFLSYTMLAGAIYVLCLILSSFREEKIRKRIFVSSMNHKKHNIILLLSGGMLIIALWFIYNVLGVIMCGKILLSETGLIYFANSLLFALCSMTIAFLISGLVSDKNAISGIVNVVALGSSFLCGAFVPSEWLPDAVIKIAHVLPSYWYIKTNDLLKTIEVYNIKTLKPIFINAGALVIFCAIFIAAANIVSAKKR